MPIFCVKSVKIYTGQKKFHEYTRGSRDKYKVWGRFQILLTFSILRGGGPSLGLYLFFFNQLLTGQRMASSGEAQLKRSPCISDLGRPSKTTYRT